MAFYLVSFHVRQDLTYAIAVDKEKKRVLVVFRGAITKADWSHATEAKFVHDRNPIREDFDGKPDEIDVHGGFHKYLFRVRQDTKTKKYVSSEVYYGFSFSPERSLQVSVFNLSPG